MKRRTHDWALDFVPLALPPDLPPVILVNVEIRLKRVRVLKVGETGKVSKTGDCGGERNSM